MLAAHYSAGGAGDKSYKVLGCRLDAQKCEVLATIDPYDQPIPELKNEGGTIVLVTNRRDSIAGFRNFSHDLQTDRGSLILRYR